MKARLAFLLLWCIPIFSESGQSGPSKCLPLALGPFAFGGAMRPATDEYLYPRYFRYVKQWDKCLAHGEWPVSKVEQFPNAYPSRLNKDQREIVTREAYDWDIAPREATLKLAAPGSAIEAGPMRITTWVQMRELSEQRKQDSAERSEKAKAVESRLEKLRLRLGETSFGLLDAYVHELFHAIPGRLALQPLPEWAMFARYLNSIAMMDKFAVNGGEDGTAAASARDEEQKACGLSDSDEETLRRVADDLQKDTQNDLIEPRGTAPRQGGSAAIREGIDSHIAQLKSDLGEASFERVAKRVHSLYESDPISRVVPLDSAKSQPDAGDQ